MRTLSPADDGHRFVEGFVGPDTVDDQGEGIPPLETGAADSLSDTRKTLP